jgi:peptide/nickel transport system substrate-binding protein
MTQLRFVLSVLALSACAADPVRVASAPLAADEIVVEGDPPEANDPAQSWDTSGWRIEYATCAKLMNYADLDGQTLLVPELASDVSLGANGTVYTFTIGTGYFFPDGTPVTVTDVQATFARALDPAMQSPAADFLADLTGMSVAGNTITLNLAAPAGDFLHRMALPFFCVVPAATPHTPIDFPPSAGPYLVVSSSNTEVVLGRNPFYLGPRPQGVATVRYRFGDTFSGQSGADVAAGLADVAPSMPLFVALDPTAGVIRTVPLLGYRYLALRGRNLFADADVRRAVSYALNRNALSALGQFSADDHLIPPGMDGHAGPVVYPLDGDLARARALMAGRRGAAKLIIASGRPVAQLIAEEVQRELDPIGIQVAIVKVQPRHFYGHDVYGNGERWDMAFEGWLADYPDPFDMLNVLVGSDLSGSHFEDAGLLGRLNQAATLSGLARTDAYAALDHDLRVAAPMVVIGNPQEQDYFAFSVGCRVVQPVYGVDLASLCRP